MAGLYGAHKRVAEATACLEEAQTLLEEIAASVPDRALRERFKEKASALLPLLRRAKRREVGG